jgi:hypothetical protein
MVIDKKRIYAILTDSKMIAIAILVITLLSLILLDPFAQVKSFQIDDKCGRFMNLMSHTINDETECVIRCKQKCISQELRYKNVDFQNTGNSCNSCTCNCKG